MTQIRFTNGGGAVLVFVFPFFPPLPKKIIRKPKTFNENVLYLIAFVDIIGFINDFSFPY